MTYEEILKIMEEDVETHWDGDNAMQGLKILEKYSSKDVLCAAQHDQIYSINVELAAKNGITEEECKHLRSINWMVEEDCFSCFV